MSAAVKWKEIREGDRQLLPDSSLYPEQKQLLFQEMKTLQEIKEMDFWRSEEGRKRGSIGVKGRKGAEMIYKATYQEPHCWSMWLCWEVSHSSAGRPPCCTSDKKPNICFLSELHSLWDPARALPLSVCVFFPVWKLILLYAFAMTGRESTPRNDAISQHRTQAMGCNTWGIFWFGSLHLRN